MKAAVISYGNITDFEFHRRLLKGYDLIICADGGAVYAKRMGIKPHAVIGDFDSCNEKSIQCLKGVNIVRYPCEKNETDTHLAVEYALHEGADHVLMTGAIGSRIDHTLANLGLLVLITEKGATGEIVDEYNRISMVRDRTLIKGKGTVVSLLPYGGSVTGITLKGFKYPVTDFTLNMGDTRGISNVLTEHVGNISIKEGLLLVIRPKE